MLACQAGAVSGVGAKVVSSLTQPCADKAVFGFKKLAQSRGLFRAVGQRGVHCLGELRHCERYFLEIRWQMLMLEVLHDWRHSNELPSVENLEHAERDSDQHEPRGDADHKTVAQARAADSYALSALVAFAHARASLKLISQRHIHPYSPRKCGMYRALKNQGLSYGGNYSQVHHAVKLLVVRNLIHMSNQSDNSLYAVRNTSLD